MIYKDDLFTAFCRICFHPDIAAAYAFFLGSYLVIPIVMVFGSIDGSSLF